MKDIEGVTVGALASEYQRSRVQAICDRLGLEMVAPLWQREPRGYWEELLDKGFRVLITKVACEGLGKEWLGREVNREALDELRKLSSRFRFSLVGEGGEYETLVLDCPLFRAPLEVIEARVEWEGDSGVWVVKQSKLGVRQSTNPPQET